MADASRPPPPFDWGEALSALPQDAPPTSRWPAIAAALEARERARRHRRIGLALAAGLCALAALPVTLHLRDAPQAPSSPKVAGVPATAAPAPTVAPTASVTTTETHAAATIATAAPRERRARTIQPRRPTYDAGDRPRAAASTIIAPTQHSLESLYAASARLESLLAVTRDPRVESGPAAAIAADYEAALAEIDARLAQPGLSIDAQRTLWQARVGTLESVAGFESQFRLLAAEGGRFDGALVSID
jgi:hypothetical protein